MGLGGTGRLLLLSLLFAKDHTLTYSTSKAVNSLGKIPLLPPHCLIKILVVNKRMKIIDIFEVPSKPN